MWAGGGGGGCLAWGRRKGRGGGVGRVERKGRGGGNWIFRYFLTQHTFLNIITYDDIAKIVNSLF